MIALVDGRPLRVEVKTSTCRNGTNWAVSINTHGGNQSWNGVVKYFERDRCEYLFVHVGDGRRWFIPSAALDCKTSLSLGGSKYAEFEIESGSPLQVGSSKAVLQSGRPPGEYRSGQTGCAVNAVALSFGGSNPPSPISTPTPIKPTNYERTPGRRGEAVINQKRRITIPQRPFYEAGFANGGRVRVRSDGPGRIIVEQIELPEWAKTPAGTERRAPA